MENLDPQDVANDLSKLITPGLRPVAGNLATLPKLEIVNRACDEGAYSVADAIESVVNRALEAMSSDSVSTSARSVADPVKALRAVLALRPGSERVKSKTRREIAARALGLLSADGWRAHHEKALLLELAKSICALEAAAISGSLSMVQAAARDQSGLSTFYSDFVDIEHDWEDWFASSASLDLAIMYGATWRNTYRKHLRRLAERPDGRIRTVLPDPSPDSLLIPTYAHTLRIEPDDFRRKVNEAIEDFKTIEPSRHVEIYLTTALLRHAIYLFSNRALLALYALCSERIPTPALLLSEGELLSFIRVDFDHLLDQSKRIT